MTEPSGVEVPLTIKWDKKSRKVGKLLERLAEVVELEAEKRVEERLDEAFEQGYALAVQEIERFGLERILENREDKGRD